MPVLSIETKLSLLEVLPAWVFKLLAKSSIELFGSFLKQTPKSLTWGYHMLVQVYINAIHDCQFTVAHETISQIILMRAAYAMLCPERYDNKHRSFLWQLCQELSAFNEWRYNHVEYFQPMVKMDKKPG
jgi:hypothetical protein